MNFAPFDEKKFRKLVESVRAGTCVLFLGAGVHHPPPPDSGFDYPADQRPPLGGELAQRLAAGCNFHERCPGENDEDLRRVGLCYEEEHGRRELVEQIRAAVGAGTEPSPAVRALAELPFPLVMTTNYDMLFERALQDERKRSQVSVYRKRQSEPARDYPGDGFPTAAEPFIFKMHGDFNEEESLVVTDEDYITFVLRMNDPGNICPIPQTFLYQLNRGATLFVGYGLLDFNLRLLFRTLRWKLDPARVPKMYAVDVHPDPLVSQVWTRDLGLDFIVEDVWRFVPRLYEAVLERSMPRAAQ